MFLINCQLRARIREIPGAGSLYIGGGVNVRGKGLLQILNPRALHAEASAELRGDALVSEYPPSNNRV